MSWRCPYNRCSGTGFVYDEERNIATDCECRPQMLAAARAAKLRGRIPDRFRHVDFGTPPVTDMPRGVVRTVQRYVDRLGPNLTEGRGLWFEGPHGTGKTTLAMLVSKKALAAGRSVAVYSVPRLLAELRDTFDDGAEMSATQLIDRLTAVELLHLDDLGAERTSPWVLEQLYSLINARYEAERAILVTTNLDRDELIEQIGARSVSRLTEICDVVPLDGEDHRAKGGIPGFDVAEPEGFEARRIAEMRAIEPVRSTGRETRPAAEATDFDPREPAWRAPAPAANLAEPDWPQPGPQQGPPAAPPSYWDKREPWPPTGD